MDGLPIVVAESQRDSATKPRVARNELPWGNKENEYNPERVAARGWTRPVTINFSKIPVDAMQKIYIFKS